MTPRCYMLKIAVVNGKVIFLKKERDQKEGLRDQPKRRLDSQKLQNYGILSALEHNVKSQ